MRLAREMHRPLHELGEQMTAEEFGLWLAFFDEEPLSPGLTGALAEVMLALHAGLMPKKPGWTLADFLPTRWKKPEPKVHVPSVDELRAFVSRRR